MSARPEDEVSGGLSDTDAAEGRDRAPFADQPGDSPATERLEAEIEETRIGMSQTIDEIEERLHPRHLMEQAKDTVKDAAGDVAGRVAGRVRDNPVPVALLAMGLGWLFYYVQSSSRGPRVSGDGVLTSGRPSLGWAVRHNPGPALVAVAGVGWLLRNVLTRQSTPRATDRVQGRFDRLLQENPIEVGVAALAVGTAIGLSMPGTAFENEHVGAARDAFVDRAQHLTQDAVRKAKGVVKEAVKNVARGENPLASI
jgi:Protein of unknown function (DUF3618)